MDFELSETQQVIAESAATVLAGTVSASTGHTEPGSDAAWRPAWQALAKAGLLALALPGAMGGDDLGVLDVAVLLTEAGRAAAAVPALATLMLGVLPAVRWGSRDLAERLLAGVGSGEVVLTAGVRERSGGLPARPATTTDPDLCTVTGTKVGVPYADDADWILVPASVQGSGRAVVVVARAAAGVSVQPGPTSGTGPECTVRLDAAPVAGVLGVGDGQADAAVTDLYQLATAGAAATADGAVSGALDLTARYVASREQFGRPLATFQAVAGEAADVYIAARTLHLAALSACWRLSVGLDAAQDCDVAAYWLASEAPAALRTCHQLHGGIGVDVSYPLHRYSAMVTDLARFVGGADYRLDVLAGAVGACQPEGRAPC